MLIVGPILAAIILGIYLILKRKHSYWSRKGLRQVKPSFLFGNFKEAAFGKKLINKVIVDGYKEFKKSGATSGGLYFMYTPIWIPVDKKLIKKILFQDFWYFAGHGYFYKHKDDILTNNLFNAEEKEWKALRSKLTPAFSSGKLKLMFDIFIEIGNRLERKVGELCVNKEPLDIKEVAACFGTDVIASCAFGMECNTLEDPENDFRKYGRKIFQPRIFSELMEQFFNWDLLNILGHSFLQKDVNEFILKLVNDMVEYRDKNKITRNDFLHLLLQLRNKDNVKDGDEKNVLSINDIAANVFVMYAAGFETTSTTISFIMYELARHQEIQDKAREEILKICECKPDFIFTYEDLQKLKYCEMIIQETLRLHTVATEVPRKCTKAYKIPGTNIIIDKGTFVLIPTWAIHTDSDSFQDPEKFDPENFSDENKIARDDMSYFPFGEGPRLCIGVRFAMMQIKLAMVKYLRKYRYELNEKTPKEISYEANTVTITPKGNILLDIKIVD